MVYVTTDQACDDVLSTGTCSFWNLTLTASVRCANMLGTPVYLLHLRARKATSATALYSPHALRLVISGDTLHNLCARACSDSASNMRHKSRRHAAIGFSFGGTAGTDGNDGDDGSVEAERRIASAAAVLAGRRCGAQRPAAGGR